MRRKGSQGRSEGSKSAGTGVAVLQGDQGANCGEVEILKLRTCKARDPETGVRCNTRFTPDRPFVKWCSPVCGVHLAAEIKAKKAAREAREARKTLREAKVKAKTRGDWTREAQAAFNRFIRLRDEGKPCVSCGSFTGKKNAGHYRSVGSAPELRFEEANCHLQCEKCNSYLSGNLINYRIELIKRIGQAAVDWLEGKHEPKKYTIQDLQEIKAIYKKKAKEIA